MESVQTFSGTFFKLARQLRIAGLEMQCQWSSAHLTPRVKARVRAMLTNGTITGGYRSAARPVASLLVRKAGLYLPYFHGKHYVAIPYGLFHAVPTLREQLRARFIQEIAVLAMTDTGTRGRSQEAWCRRSLEALDCSCAPTELWSFNTWYLNEALFQDLRTLAMATCYATPAQCAARDHALAWLDSGTPISVSLSDMSGVE